MIARYALDLCLRAQDHRRALVQALRPHFEYARAPGRGGAPRLLHQIRHRVRFVQQAQAPGFGRVLAVLGIHEQAAAHQDAVHLGDERSDPAHVEVLGARAAPAGQAFSDVALHRRFPEALVGGVDGEFAGLRRNAQIGMGEDELADLAVQGKGVHAVAQREHQHGGRAVDGIAGADLLRARLQKILRRRLAYALRAAQHRKNRAHRHVDVDIARAVERIEGEQVAAARVLRRDLVHGFQLFGGHGGEVAAPFVGAQENVVRHHVELHLPLALGVVPRGGPVHARERALAQEIGDALAGKADVVQQRGESARSTAVLALLADDEFGERSLQRHIFPLYPAA